MDNRIRRESGGNNGNQRNDNDYTDRNNIAAIGNNLN